MAAAPGFPGPPEEACEVGGVDWDLRTGQLRWDTVAEQMLLSSAACVPGTADELRALVLPEDRDHLDEALRQALKRGAEEHVAAAYEADCRILRDGLVRCLRLHGRVAFDDDGEAVGLLGVVRDVTRQEGEQRLVARALDHLPDPFALLSPEGLVTYLNPEAAALLQVTVEEGVGHRLSEVAGGLAARGALEPLEHAVESGEPTAVHLYAPISERWFEIRLLPSAEGAVVLAHQVPAPGGSPAGGGTARSLAVDLARQVFSYSTALSQADDVSSVADVVATMVLPTFGATGMIVALAESGRMRIRGHAGYDPEIVDGLDGHSLDSHTPIAEAMRTATPLFVPDLETYTAAWPAMRPLVARSGKQAWAFLPLLVGNEAIGSLTVSFGQPRVLNSDERSLMVSLAAQLAQTLARVRLRAAEHELAATLQQGLLPRRLSQPQGVRIAARYLPATRGVEVGGDWYDAVALPTGGVALVIGDVQGHSVAAAATMGQLRNALRAYAAEGHDPVTVMSRTNRVMADIAPDTFATCCYLLVDALAERVTIVSAGHPAPLIRHRDGRVEQLPVATGAPFGVTTDEVYRATSAPLREGDLLLLFTDGLVEDSATPIDAGIARVSAVLATIDADDLTAGADEVVAGALGAEHRGDDVAVLLAHMVGLSEAERPLTATRGFEGRTPGIVAECRTFVRRRLEAWPLPTGSEAIVATAVLLTSELVTNAIRYAPGPLELEVRLTHGRLRIHVRDELPAIPAPRRPGAYAESGRGLQIVEELSSRWGTIPHGHGKTVWFELDVFGA
ncbi:MAG: SpoIIE family protein phosphatase [Actinomycetes bacterium]